MMSAPSEANMRACDRPWPRAAPLITATLPVSRPIANPSLLAWGTTPFVLGADHVRLHRCCCPHGHARVSSAQRRRSGCQYSLQ